MAEMEVETDEFKHKTDSRISEYKAQINSKHTEIATFKTDVM